MNIIGKQIGSYLLVAPINSGGFGSVYRANHAILTERTVAVKLLHAAYLDKDKERERFLQEAHFLEQLSHRYILPIMDVGFTDGMPYIVFKYASGGSLRDRLRRQAGRPLPAQESLRLLTQVGQALEHAHQQKVIHRDLKPENILFNDQGEVLLSDFGLAVVVEASVRLTGIMGTPIYMAPEQFDGKVNKETDQYALGCLAYELYTGRKVFEVSGVWALAVQHKTKAPTPPTRYNPQLSAHIEKAILRALAKEPKDRYPSVSAFLHALSSTPVEEQSLPPTMQSLPPTMPSQVMPQGNRLSEAEAHLAFNRPKEALAIFEQILQLAPTNLVALVGKGKSLSALERYEEALAAFEQAAQLEPGDLSHRERQEEIRALLKQSEEVSDLSELSVGQVANAALEQYNQGKTLAKMKQYEQALQAFEKAVRLAPTNVTYQSAWGHALCNLERYPEALVIFEQILQLAPTNLPALVGKGKALAALERYEEALAVFEQAAQLEPGNILHHKRQEEIRAQLKRKEEVPPHSEPPVGQTKAASEQYKQGKAFVKMEQYEKALLAFDKAVRLARTNATYSERTGTRTLQFEALPGSAGCL